MVEKKPTHAVMKSTGIWKQRLSFTICTLAGQPKEVALHDGVVRGQWGEIEFWKQMPLGFVENFLNWGGNAEDIVRFTNKYGPVVFEPYPHPSNPKVLTLRPWDNHTWTFTLDSWRDFQHHQRVLWLIHADQYPGLDVSGPATGTEFWLSNEDEMGFYQQNACVMLQVSNLARFIEISLRALPYARMRKCKRTEEEGCISPYFIAKHLRQEYCSDICAHWGQKAVKREWWQRQQQKRSKGGKR
jgi:hypothetical protein